MKKKIAIINQRYGLEVNGGSEYYTRVLAEKLKDYYEIDVLTTLAQSYADWANEYSRNEEVINGITVKRFKVVHKRKVWKQKILGKMITFFHINTESISRKWVEAQGPTCPGLIEYIRENKDYYDCFIFVTYLYYPTVFGLPLVKEKAILIPTAHDEFCIYFKIYEKLFHMASKIVYLTEEEKEFTEKTFHNKKVSSIVAAVGVDIPEDIQENRFRSKYGIEGDYLIYVGRVDTNKGCEEMQEFFESYVRETGNSDLILVILGQKFMKIHKHAQIFYLGFVSEEDKFDGICGAKALWLPSQFESLSIAVLEAMALYKPIIVNGKCEVLKGHCKRSGGGVWYEDYDAFCKNMEFLYSEKYSEMCAKAREYIDKNYSWNVIIRKIKNFI